jgi:hypothetical protein
MEIVHRVLGIIAAIGNRLSRLSINFIKLNWVAMIGLGFLLTFAANETRYALANDRTPRAISVADALAHQDIDRNFVAVSGTLVATALFRETNSRHGVTTVKASYFPLIDRAAGRALLVKRKGDVADRRGSEETTVSGMLMPIDGDLAAELRKTGGRVDDLPIDTEYVLEAGRAPGDLVTWALTGIGSAALLLALLVVWQRRYVIFRAERTGAAADGGVPAAAVPRIDLRASGTFTLPEQKPRRFLAMPAALLAGPAGAPVLAANVDASSNIMGVRVADRRGIWTLELPADVADALEPGYQYLGFGRRPAFRIRHRGAGGKDRVTVVSCADATQRSALAALLAQPLPVAVPENATAND